MNKELPIKKLVALLSVVSALAAVAAENRYSVANGGAWETAANWSLGTVPGPDDDVVIAVNNGKTVTANAAVSVNSLTVESGALKFQAGETAGVIQSDWQTSAALIWANRMRVAISGALTVRSGATIYSANDKKTGTPVAFTCGSLTVEQGATISSVGLGYNWISGEAPEGAYVGGTHYANEKNYYTYAYGRGCGYGNGGGYGGRGTGGYGLTYGYRYAPFMPGSNAGIHSGYPKAPGGSIVIFASGNMSIAGTVTSKGENNDYGAPSGGGVWLAAATADITDTALITAEGGTVTLGYGSAGGGGRIALCFGLTDEELESLAAGNEPDTLAYVAPYGFDSCVLGGGKVTTASRGYSGTVYMVYHSDAIVTRSVKGEPDNVGAPVPGYGFHAFAAQAVPVPVEPSLPIYVEGWNNQYSISGVSRQDVAGDQPGIIWNFDPPTVLARVKIVGTGSVTVDGQTHTEDFEQWVSTGSPVGMTAAGDLAGWYGDFPGGKATASSLAVPADRPFLVTAVFSDAVGVARTYIGDANGFWDVASNWDPAGIPTPLDDLTIPSGKSVRGSNTLAAKSLTIAGSLALGGETANATTAQKLSDIVAAYTGLFLSGDLSLTGTLTLGSRTQNTTNTVMSVGGDVALSSAAKLSVYAPVNTASITSPYAGVYAARQVFAVGGDFTVDGTSVVYPVADELSGTAVEFLVASNFTLGASAKIDADKLGFNWVTTYDSRRTKTMAKNGVTYYSLSPGSPDNGYAAGGYYGAGSLAYGFPYAPFLPGAPSSAYNNWYRGGGVIWIHARGEMQIDGTMSASTSSAGLDYSGGAGGSVWLLAKKFHAGNAATLKAEGGNQTHGTMTGAGTGGRIAIGIGLTDEQIDGLAAGTDPAEVDGVTKVDDITLITTSVRGGAYATKQAGATVYERSGTIATLTGETDSTIVTVVGVPLEPTGNDGPEYGAIEKPKGETATFTASSRASLAGEENEIRYVCTGWVCSNLTSEVASGAGMTAQFVPGNEPLTLIWFWETRETRVNPSANNDASGSAAVSTEWTADGNTVSITATPEAGCEFLCWQGDVPFGLAMRNPADFTAGKDRALTAVFRTNEVACTRTWVGGNGDYYDAAKWSPAGIPGKDDDIVIDSGTVTVVNYLAAKTLTLGGNAVVKVADTPSKNLEEARVVVAEDLSMAGTAKLYVGKKEVTYHGVIEVGGDFVLAGTNVVQISGGVLEGDFSFASGSGFVTVGGDFKVLGQSKVYPISEGYTGGSVVFTVGGRFELGEEAKFDAVDAGFRRYSDRIPDCIAPGVGWDYTPGAGYGGKGLRVPNADWNSSGQTYGQLHAPIHPGSAKGSYGEYVHRGGGLIRIHAKSVKIDGWMDASAKNDNTSTASSCSGGGIWVTASEGQTGFAIGATAKFYARGGFKITGAGHGGGGGRIALAWGVDTAAKLEALTTTGLLPGKTMAKMPSIDEAAFEARYPGVDVDVRSTSETSDARCQGTFSFVDARTWGMAILVR